MAEDFEKIQGELREIKETIQDILTEIQGELREIKETIQDILTEIQNLKEQINPPRREVTEPRESRITQESITQLVNKNRELIERLEVHTLNLVSLAQTISGMVSPCIVYCPQHNVPMTPELAPSGNGYRLCFRDNYNHSICPD